MNDRITKKVVVDAGHGGSDPGASNADVIEKEYNLKIANYIYNRLKELGIPTYITRSTDETITPTDRVNRILNAFGNSNDVIVLSNHLNSGGGDGSCGKLTFFEKNRQVSIQSLIKYTYFLNYKTY